MGSIGELTMNVDSIFTYSCPFGYTKFKLTIFRVIPDLIRGRTHKLSFLGFFIGGSMRVE